MTNPAIPVPVPTETTSPEGLTTEEGTELMVRAEALGLDAWNWLKEHVLTPENLMAIGVQLGVIVLAIIIGRLLAPHVRRWIDLGISTLPEPTFLAKLSFV